MRASGCGACWTALLWSSTALGADWATSPTYRRPPDRFSSLLHASRAVITPLGARSPAQYSQRAQRVTDNTSNARFIPYSPYSLR